MSLRAVPGADIEQPPVEAVEPLKASDAASDLSTMARGKVNEIDFCIAPADVSLSRAYGSTPTTSSSDNTASTPILSLTRALNNASNRAVRRILLARSWPSAEALNLSLRRVAAAEKERARAMAPGSGGKCPVPRPILNVLTRKREGKQKSPMPRGRTDEEYVADQLKSFRERYGELPGYECADAYLDSILSLATSGVESSRVPEVLQAGIYDESYKRVLNVLKSVGMVLETDPDTGISRIAAKLVDQDVCLSMLDKLRLRNDENGVHTVNDSNSEKNVPSANRKRKQVKDQESDKDEDLTRDDLGAVLLSSEEPSVTGQLNVLSNIVLRALLFGGDQELLVLAETLEADREAFIDRWYPNTGEGSSGTPEGETRPGVQYLDCLVQLLRICYENGVVTDLAPTLQLSQSYANAYDRLVASAVELGSGYLKPLPGDVMMMPKPRTAKEELGRFAVWESTFRQSPADDGAYPEDLEGVWEVRDLVGSEIIGISKVVFGPQGDLTVDPPLEGLRWRLDPGPTHLDTCTFQVLSSDGTILQYRGFIDRGARLEARFSKRSIRIRGSVMFQMRDGSIDYYKDMLPINYKTGTTKFVMTKKSSAKS